MQLPAETADEIRRAAPLACPYCAAEGYENTTLTMFDRGVEALVVGAVLGCSRGHTYLLAIAAPDSNDGRVHLGHVEVAYEGLVLAELGRA